MPAHPNAQFISWFRSVAPYFHAFRGKTFVLAFGGEIFVEGKFVELAHDINLLHSAGIRVVLVHGSRPQIEAQLKRRKTRSHYAKGLRITDPVALECVKEAVGLLRVEIDALLSLGLPNRSEEHTSELQSRQYLVCRLLLEKKKKIYRR